MEERIWHIFLTAVIAIISTLFGVVTWFVKGKINEYDKHLDEAVINKRALALIESKVGGCADKNALMLLESKLDEHTEDLSLNSRIIRWIGDCIITLGVRLNIKLPPRPE